MSIIPSGLARFPNGLSAQVLENALRNVNQDLLRVQEQLATGREINRPSDDAIGASAVTVLDSIIERRDQTLRNLSHADSILANVDQGLGDANDLFLEAKSIGLSQIGITADPDTRANQALVIDSLLRELLNVGNRSVNGIQLFSGEATAITPFRESKGGIVYDGEGPGMITDLGSGLGIPITVGGDEAFGALSARVQGSKDLDPGMTLDTRLHDLNGAQGLGVRLGTVNVDINGNDFDLDLTNANRVQDVIDELTTLINTEAPGALGVNGITVDPATGNRFNIDLNPGFVVTIGDPGSNTTAADLGLSAAPFEDGVNETGENVDPRLTEFTPLSALNGVTGPLGLIRITNGTASRELDLSTIGNVQELKNAVEGLGIGVRVEIAESGDRLNFVNEHSGNEMSIGEVAGDTTATELGVRSLAAETKLDDFNNGLGVEIVSGNLDPQTGLPDPARDTDFRVTLKDGRSFDVDLVGSQTVQDVLDGINTAAGAAGVIVPAEFEAHLVADGNGIALTDNTAGTTTSVTALNGSFAAEDLGILNSTTGATLNGEDRARIAVDSAFSHLIALRDALLDNDERGISLATQRIDEDLDRFSLVRAEVGVRARRVTRQTEREDDLNIQDQALRSRIQDLDFSEAAIRFSTLQQQLQATLTTAARTTSLSLLDFLR